MQTWSDTRLQKYIRKYNNNLCWPQEYDTTTLTTIKIWSFLYKHENCPPAQECIVADEFNPEEYEVELRRSSDRLKTNPHTDAKAPIQSGNLNLQISSMSSTMLLNKSRNTKQSISKNIVGPSVPNHHSTQNPLALDNQRKTTTDKSEPNTIITNNVEKSRSMSPINFDEEHLKQPDQEEDLRTPRRVKVLWPLMRPGVAMIW